MSDRVTNRSDGHEFYPMGVTTICEPPVYQRKCSRCPVVENTRRGKDLRELDEAFKLTRSEGYEYRDEVWYHASWPPSRGPVGENLVVAPVCGTSADTGAGGSEVSYAATGAAP